MGSWKFADKLDWLRNRGDKKLNTTTGQDLLNKLQLHYHTDRTDDLMPWIVREWKKGRLQYDPSAGSLYDSEPAVPWQGTSQFIIPDDVRHWGDWFHSTSPTRRGTDIMQLTLPDLKKRIADWDEELAAEMDKEQEMHGEVVHNLDDGWTIRRLQNAKEAEAEGDAMGHCVGGYGHYIDNGTSLIYSLRDPKNQPHATVEITPRMLQADDGEKYEMHGSGAAGYPVPHGGKVVQIQGKQNAEPNEEYKEMLRDWFNSFHYEHTPHVEAEWEEQEPGTDIEELDDDYDYPEGMNDWEYNRYGMNSHDAEEYGLNLNPEYPPPRPDPDYPQVLESMVSGRDGQIPYRKQEGHVLYEFAKERGNIPQLQEAVQKHEEEATDRFERYYYPEYITDEEGNELKYPHREDYTNEKEFQNAEERYLEAEMKERDWQMGEDPDFQMTHHLYPMLNKHWNPETEQYENPIYSPPEQEPSVGPGTAREPNWNQTTLFSSIRPVYYRFVYSPQSGDVTLAHNQEDPTDVRYHHDLAAEAHEPGLYHGYAYRLGNGWRLTTWDHKPFSDPHIVRQVTRAIRSEESPQDGSGSVLATSWYLSSN